MRDLIATLLLSKKFIMSIVGIVTVVSQELGVPISEEAVFQIIGLVGVYVGAQGIADMNKHAPTKPVSIIDTTDKE